ncbi:hypothetical protein HOP50_13g69710 [Chloropicon primus]|uniref:Uncharacterized protein n=1 Tax=Chloropicon primus TaxID=1764295 RepID=A0A5B8MV28_9CHLO|nr:hypothetical protein A3770_13p69510 [Chloropicon primus]UPR03641.1 hypothetical protein HOP50_13g69710 [Chloropicon primus]|mmetsp:Transcript_9357/g.26607  ORF Transcript_9357/g.26607 Transcript_9357/m.26607 type:complete len:441 (+) Transcript_9357:2473-3795(+)|eukprot:QDZ24433.1 hypothetical protein A3770_13p69510 [Chloropicon primus]
MACVEGEEEEEELLRAFSTPRLDPSRVLAQAKAREDVTTTRRKLLTLWSRYWNSWETSSLPTGVWWDRGTINELVSKQVLLLKPEGAFQGREVVLDEYENFAKRFPASRQMERRLTQVFVDEKRRATTAAYEVVIPEGILAEDEDEEGGEGRSPGGERSLVRRRSATSRIFSVAEVLVWDLEGNGGDGSLKEIHYFGSGVRLTTSKIKGKLHRARQHRRRHGNGAQEEEELAAELGLGSLGSREDCVLITSTVSDDRPLVQLTFKYIESLLKWDRETVMSLVTESYKHLTAFGDSFLYGGVGRGEIDSVYCDEALKAVSIERRYETDEKMTEIIDLIYWEDPGPRINRHTTYGFSWQSRVGSRPPALETKTPRKTVNDLLNDEAGKNEAGASVNRVRSRGSETGEEDDDGLQRGGSLSKSKKNRSETNLCATEKKKVGFL